LDAAITKLKNAKAYTLKVAALMPEDKYAFKPTASEMGFGEQLLHLAKNIGWLSSSYLSKAENPVTETDSKLQKKDEIIKVLEKSYNFAIQVLQNFNAADFGDTVKFFAGPMNKLQIINLLNDYQTHHQGQVLVYLRLNNVKPPDYVGW
jgi:uncharacterized damage-inducible protein DinB